MPRSLAILLTLIYTNIVAAQSTRLSAIGEGWSQTSVNTAIFRSSSLASADSAGTTFQYACYYSANGMLTIARREQNSDIWAVNETNHRGHVEDGHNVISMAIDGDGFLHVAYDHHNNTLHYRKSIQPFAIELSDEICMIGEDEDDVTYPEFHNLPSGNLIFLYRTGRSGCGNMVMNSYDLRTKTWHRVQHNLIDGEGKRNAYWQMTTDKKGRIHLSWVWRETWLVETNHDLCYAYSDDEGRTWHKSDGSAYSLPIRMRSAEIAWSIPQKSELINQTSMAADADGHPYIATYWRDSTSTIPQYRVVWHDGTSWNMQQVSLRKSAFTLAGGGTKMIPIARPRMVIDDKQAVFIFRDEERGSKVSVYTNKDIKKNEWEIHDLTDFGVGAWEPSIDETLWDKNHTLNIFVQPTFQGDGEKTVQHDATTVYVLEYE